MPDNLRLVALRDDLAVNAHFPYDRFDVFSRPSINGKGEVAFSATTSGPSGIREGIWIARPNGTGFSLTCVVIRGQPAVAPQLSSGVTFQEFPDGFSFNSQGQLAFLATLSLTAANNPSLWLHDSNQRPGRRLRLIAQRGNPCPVTSKCHL